MAIYFRPNKVGQQHPRSKLLDQERGLIQKRLDAGASQRQMARAYGVHQKTVYRIHVGPDYRDEA